MFSVIQALQRGLVVSCQAPAESPMHEPVVIAAMAEAAVKQGAVGVRIDSPAHIRAVRQRVSAPIIGLWKQQIPGYEVYITPQFHHAAAIAEAGADIIAIDATVRPRPNHETMAALIDRIHTELKCPVMADVDTLESAIAAAEAGADLIGTTLYGYTAETHNLKPPGLELLTQMVKTLNVPIICEGGIASAQMARQAIDLGAYAVVVGTAITGVDLQVQAYRAAVQTEVKQGTDLGTINNYQIKLFREVNSAHRQFIDTQMRNYAAQFPEVQPFFSPPVPLAPLDLFIFDRQQNIVAGLIGYTRWNWLHIDLVWVDSSLRKQGYGTKLMQQAEQEAKNRGCQAVRLATLSFQAKEFYEKLGYQVFGQLADYPVGQTHYLLSKSLAE